MNLKLSNDAAKRLKTQFKKCGGFRLSKLRWKMLMRGNGLLSPTLNVTFVFEGTYLTLSSYEILTFV